MKVCQNCGIEIDTVDGDNHCRACDEAGSKKELQAQRRKNQRRDRDEAMRSLGLVKVRGAMGGVYWE